MPPADPFALVADAISFAARAHRHQLRKDGQTPYVAHPARVAFVVRNVFDIADPEVLAAAVLHDTIEDTTTDYDDLRDRFGPNVAAWVAALTKDSRLAEPEREAAYCRQLAAGGWQVAVCKLADCYDNLAGLSDLSPAARRKQVAKTQAYLDALAATLPPEAVAAFAVVAARLTRAQAAP